LKPLVLETKNCVSHISKLEVPGFPRLQGNEKQYLENVFKILKVMPINDAVSKYSANPYKALYNQLVANIHILWG